MFVFEDNTEINMITDRLYGSSNMDKLMILLLFSFTVI